MFLPSVPRVSSYHTNIALYAKHFGYSFLSPVIWALQRNFHGQCAKTMCPSPSTSRALIEHQFPEEKLKIWNRGVDTQLFSPSKRRKELRESWIGNDEMVLLLYVGRVSWEKNLKSLSQAYINLCSVRNDVHLVITGDGPARPELEATFLENKVRVTFTGYLQGNHQPTQLMHRRGISCRLRFLRSFHFPFQIRDLRASRIRGSSFRSSRHRISGGRRM